jgi:hypothetical protein
VLEVADTSRERLLRVLHDQTGTCVVVHLRDGWADTPVTPGDPVHLIAHVTDGDGELHTHCDYKSGVLPDVSYKTLVVPAAMGILLVN